MMKQSVKAFQKAAALKDTFKLYGDTLIVETLDMQAEQAASNSGIVVVQGDRQMGTKSANLPVFCRVLAVGAGYYDEESKEAEPTDVNPGDIILIGQNSLTKFSQFGKLSTYAANEVQLGICNESAIHMRFHGDEGYEKFFETLVEEMK